MCFESGSIAGSHCAFGAFGSAKTSERTDANEPLIANDMAEEGTWCEVRDGDIDQWTPGRNTEREGNYVKFTFPDNAHKRSQWLHLDLNVCRIRPLGSEGGAFIV